MVRRKAFIESHRVWRLAAGTVLSLGLLWLAARGVSWAELGVAIRFARWHLIAVAVVLCRPLDGAPRMVLAAPPRRHEGPCDVGAGMEDPPDSASF